MSKKQIRSKRRLGGTVEDINDFSLLFELDAIIRIPEKVPTECESLTLKEWGFSIENFRKNIDKFNQALEQAHERTRKKLMP